jgi:hypothetical protein
LQICDSGTTWPASTPSDTAARRKGQGLSGETSGPGALLAGLSMLVSCMDLNPENWNYEMRGTMKNIN